MAQSPSDPNEAVQRLLERVRRVLGWSGGALRIESTRALRESSSEERDQTADELLQAMLAAVPLEAVQARAEANTTYLRGMLRGLLTDESILLGLDWQIPEDAPTRPGGMQSWAVYEGVTNEVVYDTFVGDTGVLRTLDAYATPAPTAVPTTEAPTTTEAPVAATAAEATPAQLVAEPSLIAQLLPRKALTADLQTTVFGGSMNAGNLPAYASGQIDKSNRFSIELRFYTTAWPLQSFVIVGEGGSLPDSLAVDGAGTAYGSRVELGTAGDYLVDVEAAANDGCPLQYSYSLAVSFGCQYVQGAIGMGWTTGGDPTVVLSSPTSQGNLLDVFHIPKTRSWILRGVYYVGGSLRISGKVVVGDQHWASRDEIGHLKLRLPLLAAMWILTPSVQAWTTLEYSLPYVRGNYLKPAVATIEGAPAGVFQGRVGEELHLSVRVHNQSQAVALVGVQVLVDVASLEGKLTNAKSPWTQSVGRIEIGEAADVPFAFILAREGVCSIRFIVEYQYGEPVPVEHAHRKIYCEASVGIRADTSTPGHIPE